MSSDVTISLPRADLRVWHKSAATMIYSRPIEWSIENSEGTHHYYCPASFNLGELSNFKVVGHDEDGDLVEDELIEMRRTGLKDKNGVEIYEGDIVRLDEDVCPVYWDVEDARFALDFGTSVDGFTNIAGYHVEVIGNIYEHPHLLGQAA
jgi:uncharacterized phage protein (TIGR01671 family)